MAGDVVVPDGEFCQLDGTTVRGNVAVRPDALLDMVGATVEGTVTLTRSEGSFGEASRVTGNIQATDAAFVDFTGITVGGDIQAERRTRFAADRLTVNGNLQAKQVSFVDLQDSTVNGTFTVERAEEGSIFCGNRFNGNTEFRDNGLLVQIGGSPECAGNEVEGNKEGQCATL